MAYFTLCKQAIIKLKLNEANKLYMSKQNNNGNGHICLTKRRPKSYKKHHDEGYPNLTKARRLL